MAINRANDRQDQSALDLQHSKLFPKHGTSNQFISLAGCVVEVRLFPSAAAAKSKKQCVFWGNWPLCHCLMPLFTPESFLSFKVPVVQNQHLFWSVLIWFIFLHPLIFSLFLPKLILNSGSFPFGFYLLKTRIIGTPHGTQAGPFTLGISVSLLLREISYLF